MYNKALCKVYMLQATTIIAIIVFSFFFLIVGYVTVKLTTEAFSLFGKNYSCFFENFTFRHLVLEIYIP